MVEPRYRWTFGEALIPTPPAVEAAAGHGVSVRMAASWPPVASSVPRRSPPGSAIRSTASTTRPDCPMPACSLRGSIAPATCGERVLVFGDFDADGLTGLAIMTLALRRFGVAVEPYVPSRLDEGHGLSLAAIEAAATGGCAAHRHRRLRVDERGRGRGGERSRHRRHRHGSPPRPGGHARRARRRQPAPADSTYPDRRLAGSGVAFKVAQLLLADEPGGPAAALDLADLATIGSVADVAPVVGENRAIARLGLERLRRAPRPGIAALLERARIDPAAVDLETVSFAIAPRLNAAGRVGEAIEAARLLLATDAVEAGRHADALEAANLTRRDLMKTAVAEARAAVGEAPVGAATIVRGPWSVGIVGLVAARLAEDRGRPAIVGAELGDVVRASCRSDGSLDLAATLEQCCRPVHPLRRPRRRRRVRDPGRPLGRVPRPVPRSSPGPRSRPIRGRRSRSTWRSPPIDVDYALYRELAGLAPCGPGNPDPLVAVLGLTVTRVRAATGGHSQLTVRRERDVLDGIAFGRPDIAEVVHEGDRVDIVARLTSRTFGGFESLQLDIRDVATSGQPCRDGGDPCRAVDPGARAGRERVMTMAPNPSPRSGLAVGSPGRWLAPVLSIVGLLIVAFVTLNLLNGQLPFVGGSSGNGNGNGNGNGDAGPDVTPAPSNKVVIPEEVVSFKGSILYVKAGNVWVQTGKEAHQLTSSGQDSMPSWSPDGTTVYFVRTTDGTSRWPSAGVLRDYQLSTPAVMRVKADGSGDPEMVLNGKVTQNGRTWHSWIREPVLSPDGKTLAMVSDRPDPTNSDVVLQFYDLNTKKSRVPNLERGAAARAPGSGVAVRRQGAALRPQRPERAARDAGDLALERGDVEGLAADRARATWRRPTRPMAGTWRPPRPAPSATTS